MTDIIGRASKSIERLGQQVALNNRLIVDAHDTISRAEGARAFAEQQLDTIAREAGIQPTRPCPRCNEPRFFQDAPRDAACTYCAAQINLTRALYTFVTLIEEAPIDGTTILSSLRCAPATYTHLTLALAAMMEEK